MAEIMVYNHSDFLIAQLISLDTSYAGSERTAYWYISEANSIVFNYKGETKLENGKEQSDLFYFRGLEPEAVYIIKCNIRNTKGDINVNLQTVVKTYPQTAYPLNLEIVQTTIGKKTALCSWETIGLRDDTIYEIYIDKNENFETESSELVADGWATQYMEVEIPFDDFGTYNILHRLFGEYSSYLCSREVEILKAPDLTPWSWEATEEGCESTSLQRRNAKKAVDKAEGYSVLNFTYQVWNDLVNKVNQAIQTISAIDGSTWETEYADPSTGETISYLSYDDTLMTENDKVLTADRFNTLKFNIGCRVGSGYVDNNGDTQSGTGIADVNKGDIVYGRYFTRLTESLNNWIQNLAEIKEL